MKPVDQNKFGEEGNCMQASIASLMDVHLEFVPNYGMQSDWFMRLNNWLRQFDLGYIEYDPSKEKNLAAAPGVWCVLIGPSERGLMHATVGKIEDGKVSVSHDPHPDRKGITTIQSIGFLISLNPGSQVTSKVLQIARNASSFPLRSA